MAQITINLDVEDINSYRLGENIAVELVDGTLITFTQEAIEELIDDYEYIFSTEVAEQEAEEERLSQPVQKYTLEELIPAIAETKAERKDNEDYGRYTDAERKMDDKLLQLKFEQAFNSPHAFYVQCGDCLCEVYNITDVPQEWLEEIFDKDERLKW